MKAAIPDDFKIELGAAERALRLESYSLTSRHRCAYTIAPDGKQYVWAGDVIRSVRPRYPQRAFAMMMLATFAKDGS